VVEFNEAVGGVMGRLDRVGVGVQGELQCQAEHAAPVRCHREVALLSVHHSVTKRKRDQHDGWEEPNHVPRSEEQGKPDH